MNYFHYFTEIEDRFSQRRGSILMLSTLDWALIETWREAGIPLEAVLRGIDAAFDKHDAKRTARSRKVNGLAWCAQAVMQATEELHEAATGIHKPDITPQDTGLESKRVASFLDRNAALLAAATPGAPHLALEMWASTELRLTELAAQMRSTPLALDDLDRNLTILEERLITALTNAAPEAEIVALRTQADHDLAPYRAKLQPAQLKQIQSQYMLKKLMQTYNLPRLSLFYMDVGA